MAEKQLAVSDKSDTGRPKRLTRWQVKFLEALREAPHIGLACKAAGISRDTAYKHRRDNPLFAGQWSSALDDALDDLEVVAFREAMRGNTQLTIFLLKSHRKNVYGDTHRHEHALLGKILILPAKAEGDE